MSIYHVYKSAAIHTRAVIAADNDRPITARVYHELGEFIYHECAGESREAIDQAVAFVDELVEGVR